MEKVQFLNYFQDGVCFKKLKFVGADDRIVKKREVSMVQMLEMRCVRGVQIFSEPKAQCVSEG